MSTGVRAGAVVAGFRLTSLVGEGAMGTVYLAEDPRGDRRVALKLLAPELARDERFRRRFLRETELAATLDHPNVVRTLAAGEEDGTLYLAMEYVEGNDLRHLLRREGRLEPERAIGLLAQVAGALDAAHEAGLVHRDVKPANILISLGADGERADVCDFGLARHISSVSSLTTESGFVGTIDYVPPEQVEGGEIDGRADGYSLGCVLYECLAGARPFDRDSELAVVFAHLNEPPPRLSELRPDLPETFDAVFATALAKSPEDRYATCAELVDAARAALAGKAVKGRRRTSRRSLVAAAAAVLVAAAAATAGVLVTRGGSGSSPPAITPPAITQTSIAGVKVGLRPAAYKRRLGAYRAFTITEFANYHVRGLQFQQPQIGVYFGPGEKTAGAITTWDPNYRTAEGIGPCSTLAAMKATYGRRVVPTAAGTSPDGKKVWSWGLGRKILFATQDQRTIAAVALYKGAADVRRRNRATALANYVAALETACK